MKREWFYPPLLILLAGACGRGEPPDVPEAATTEQQGLPDISEPPGAGEPLEPQGRYYVFLEKFDTSRVPARVEVDVVQYLHDREALDAEIEDGLLVPGELPPNDFYVRNQSAALRTLELPPEARIRLLSLNEDGSLGDLTEVNIARLLDAEVNNRYEGIIYSGLFLMELDQGRIARLDAEYLP